MSEEARKPPVFSCGYSEQNPVYCQQCGGHEHLCKKPLSDRWCEYANHLIAHGNDITALSMRTNLLAEMNAHADHTAAIREAIQNVIKATEEAACSCSVCGVIKGENRGCYAYRANKGHNWRYIAYLEESDVRELTALKAALEGNDG